MVALRPGVPLSRDMVSVSLLCLASCAAAEEGDSMLLDRRALSFKLEAGVPLTAPATPDRALTPGPWPFPAAVPVAAPVPEAPAGVPREEATPWEGVRAGSNRRPCTGEASPAMARVLEVPASSPVPGVGNGTVGGAVACCAAELAGTEVELRAPRKEMSMGGSSVFIVVVGEGTPGDFVSSSRMSSNRDSARTGECIHTDDLNFAQSKPCSLTIRAHAHDLKQAWLLSSAKSRCSKGERCGLHELQV